MIGLRPAVADDAEVLADIHLVSRQQAMPWLPELYTREEVVAWMRHVVLPGSSVWVAECEGQVAGYAVLKPGELDQLYVYPHFQGRGVGSCLLTHVQALSPQGLGLSVFQRNLRARQFYEAHGFTPAGSSDGSGNEEGLPDMRYEWRGKAR